MPARWRRLWLAGAIAIIILVAPSRSRPLVRSATSPSSTVISPRAPVSRAPLAPIANPSGRDRPVARWPELLRSARFAELIDHTLDVDDAEEQAPWLSACARLAPPRLLVEHALRMRPGAARDSLLDSAIDRWVTDSPVEAGTWISAHVDDDHALDFVLARIIEHTDTVHRTTSSALGWVNLIHDPALRFRALQAVVREWADSDPDAACLFAKTAPGLSAEEHVSLLSLFVPPVIET